MTKTFDELAAHLENVGAQEPLEYCQACAQKLLDFAPHVPVVRALSSPALREQHWGDLSAVVGFPLSAENITNLTNLLELAEKSADMAERLWDVAAAAETAAAEAVKRLANAHGPGGSMLQARTPSMRRGPGAPTMQRRGRIGSGQGTVRPRGSLQGCEVARGADERKDDRGEDG